MFKRQISDIIICLALVLCCCCGGRAVPGKTGAGKYHLGGCILISPGREVPDDPYRESGIVPTDEYKPFTKKLSVYGITLTGRDDISDEFMQKVAEIIKAMFPRGGSIDAGLQEEVLKNLYRYRAVIPLFKGEEHEFAPADKKLWEVTSGRNSICDIIMEGVPGQVNEVVEHILHYVTDIGLHYAMPAEWGISKTSRVYRVMQEAIEKKYYDIRQYHDIPAEEKTRVLIQEYAYWIIYCTWDLRETFGPKQAEYSIMNSSELKTCLPGSYDLVARTIPRIMAPPPPAMLKQFFE